MAAPVGRGSQGNTERLGECCQPAAVAGAVNTRLDSCIIRLPAGLYCLQLLYFTLGLIPCVLGGLFCVRLCLDRHKVNSPKQCDD